MDKWDKLFILFVAVIVVISMTFILVNLINSYRGQSGESRKYYNTRFDTIDRNVLDVKNYCSTASGTLR